MREITYADLKNDDCTLIYLDEKRDVVCVVGFYNFVQKVVSETLNKIEERFEDDRK